MLTAYKHSTTNEIVETNINQSASWINVVEPDREEIEQLIEQYNLPEDFIRDPLDADESARIEYFDRLNVFDQDVLTVVASSQCKYLKPVFYPDMLHIGARVEEMRNSAIRMHYVLFSQQQQQIVADGEAVIVFVDKVEMKKTLIPQQLRKVIIDLEATVHNDLVNT